MPNNIVWGKSDGTLAVTWMADPNADTVAHSKELLTLGVADPSWVLLAHGYNFTADPAEHRHANGAITHVGPDAVPPPSAVMMLQLRKALRQVSLIDPANAAVAAAPPDQQETWQFAQVIKRTDPVVATIGTKLNIDSVAVDKLFKLAVTL